MDGNGCFKFPCRLICTFSGSLTHRPENPPYMSLFCWKKGGFPLLLLVHRRVANHVLFKLAKVYALLSHEPILANDQWHLRIPFNICITLLSKTLEKNHNLVTTVGGSTTVATTSHQCSWKWRIPLGCTRSLAKGKWSSFTWSHNPIPSTPQKTSMTIEKQPWMRMYLLLIMDKNCDVSFFFGGNS